MPSVYFDGTDDRLVLTTMSAAMQDVGTGAWTFAVLYKKTTTPSWACPFFYGAVDNATTNAHLAFEQQSNTYQTIQTYLLTNSNLAQALSTGVNYLFVASKAAGTVQPVSQQKTIGGSWSSPGTHAVQLGDSADNLDATAKLTLGGWPNTDYFGGRIGLVAFWHGVNMTQAQREECGTGESTSALYNHSAGTPTSLIELDSITEVHDFCGGVGAVSSVTGATVDSDDLGWTFDGTGGGGGEPQIILPNGDLATTGWATAPLFSKVNDESDATVITATSA